MNKLISSFLLVSYLSTSFLWGQEGDYVTIREKEFYLNGRPFFPVALNYTVNISYTGDVQKPTDEHIGPAYTYKNNEIGSYCPDKNSCIAKIEEDFVRIREMGFNTIRLIGLPYGIVTRDSFGQDTSKNPAICVIGKAWSPQYFREFTYPYGDIFKYLDEILLAAKKADLKVILLVAATKVGKDEYKNGFYKYLETISDRYKNNSALFAYDLCNEPLLNSDKDYYENLTKEDVCKIVSNYCGIIRKNTPNQLITIGFLDSREVFKWDPNLLNIDFSSFHVYPETSRRHRDTKEFIYEGTYEQSINRVKSDIYWFSNISNKPWIIGETSFTANLNFVENRRGNNGTLIEQKNYAENTLNFCRDCKSNGYSWWNYHDGDANDGLGVINNADNEKEVVLAFKNFNITNVEVSNCIRPDNYFNYYELSENSISGKVLDADGNPIINAVILGVHGDDPKYSYEIWTQTYTDNEGNFTLWSQKEIKNIKISAANYEVKEKNVWFFKNINNSEVKLKTVDCESDLSNGLGIAITLWILLSLGFGAALLFAFLWWRHPICLWTEKCVIWTEETIKECKENKDLGYNQCAQEADQGYNNCSQTVNQGYDNCAQTANQRYSQCCDWWPCRVLCKVLVWFDNIVCVAWVWVSNIVCVAWVWIKNMVCVAWVWIKNMVCVAWATIVKLTCKFIEILTCW